MLDFYDTVQAMPTFRKFKVGELLFAQYTCPLREPSVGIWAHMDHFIHVLSGEKTWNTPAGSWTVKAGETMFFKKGAYVLRQNFHADFCVMLFFVPDGFVRQVTKELMGELPVTPPSTDIGEMAVPVRNNAPLSAFLQSMAAYFADRDQPPEALLRLKLSELITGILLGRDNRTLSAYFRATASSELPSLPAIMEANWRHNLSLEAFARMCHRSLSSFKRKFHECYGVAPGRWLLDRRLERASVMLGNSEMSVTEIVYECAFESPAHFSRAFKLKFSRSPSEYREMIRLRQKVASEEQKLGDSRGTITPKSPDQSDGKASLRLRIRVPSVRRITSGVSSVAGPQSV